MATPEGAFDAAEMSKYGFDPADPEDVRFWLDTAPANPDAPVTDYSADPFEYGGILLSQTVEMTPPKL